jgi:hypothetical protein
VSAVQKSVLESATTKGHVCENEASLERLRTMKDDELRQDEQTWQLFDAIVAQLKEAQAADPSLVGFEVRHRALSITRNGHIFNFACGSANRIGSGGIRWRPNRDGDKARTIGVSRSALGGFILAVDGRPGAGRVL